MADAYVAAGSNVRPRASLARALALLEGEFPGLRASRAYSNPAVGFTGDDFINLVVVFPADLPTEDLLDRLKAIERACGREPGAPKWGPRTLDLDLLLHGERVGRVAGKNLPHPDLLTRAWVLGRSRNSRLRSSIRSWANASTACGAASTGRRIR